MTTRLFQFLAPAILGAAAGMLTYHLPPMPSRTLTLPVSICDAKVVGVSSDGRFAVVHARYVKNGVDHHAHCSAVFVWDNNRQASDPLLVQKFAIDEGLLRVTFSPDEISLAVTSHRNNPDYQLLVVYNLEASNSEKWVLDSGASVFFDPSGELFVTGDANARGIGNGGRITSIDNQDDDFKFENTLGTFALFRREDTLRVYSWSTGRLVCCRDVPTESLFTQISTGGDVLSWWSPNVNIGPPRVLNPTGVMSMESGEFVIANEEQEGFWRMSSDGRVVAHSIENTSHSMFLRWVPYLGDVPKQGIRLVNWSSKETVVDLPGAKEITFSERGNTEVDPKNWTVE